MPLHPENCSELGRPGVFRLEAHMAGRWLIYGLSLFFMFWLSGCGSLPTVVARSPSSALAARPEAPLVKIAQKSAPADRQSAELSGFRLLPLGVYSLDARLQLIDRASYSLDVQYYVLDNDASGQLLLSKLAQAAERGVRVRLLVDDLYTTHTDGLLLTLAARPNVEVRLFNPFGAARDSGLVGRFVGSLFEARRLNHRMHNKLLIADGAMAIAGGRNIADDYFQRGAQYNFVDLDALIVGSVVGELARSFDDYWNSPVVFPIAAISTNSESADVRRSSLMALVAASLAAPPLELPEVDALGHGPIGKELNNGQLGLIWGRAMALADPPDKLSRDADKAYADSLAYQALMKIWTADQEVTITSPYLIPGPLGISAFEALGRKKVKVTVLTNSLAATDEPLVHTGYSRYRPSLLDAGVELYELSPTRTQRNTRLGLFGSSVGRLHAKTAVVDGNKTFFGSMNLDPRSRTQNTELGVFVESAELAEEMLKVVKISKLQNAYRVRHSEQRTLQWVAVDDDAEQVLESEPESSLWMQIQNFILAPFVPEQLL